MHVCRVIRFQPKRVQITYRISLYICISVQAHAAVYASYDYVLVDKASDIDVVIARSHVVESVVIACDTILSVIEKSYFSIASFDEVSVWTVGIAVLDCSCATSLLSA